MKIGARSRPLIFMAGGSYRGIVLKQIEIKAKIEINSLKNSSTLILI